METIRNTTLYYRQRAWASGVVKVTSWKALYWQVLPPSYSGTELNGLVQWWLIEFHRAQCCKPLRLKEMKKILILFSSEIKISNGDSYANHNREGEVLSSTENSDHFWLRSQEKLTWHIGLGCCEILPTERMECDLVGGVNQWNQCDAKRKIPRLGGTNG